MKKFMYLIPFAAVALASCSNESTDSQQSRVAQSNTAALNIVPVVQGTTRGTVYTDANLQAFKVKAASENDVFVTTTSETAPNLADPGTFTEKGASFEETVNLNKTTGKWYIGSTEGTYYWWKSKAMTATFTAWAPTTFDPTTNYQVKNDIANQEDVIVAYNNGTASEFTAGVPLNFQHALSQVIIKALNKDASEYKIEVAGIKLNNLKNTGSITMPTTSTASGFTWASSPWTLGTPIYSYVTGGDKATAADMSSGFKTLTTSATQLTSEPFILMPQTTAKADLTDNTNNGAYFSVLVRVTKVSDGSAVYPKLANADPALDAKDYFAYVAIPVDIDWKAGYKYTYTLNFSKTGIGKVDPHQPTDKPADQYKYPTGEDDTNDPGDDILDGPVQLFFTVTVEDWIDGGDSPLNM